MTLLPWLPTFVIQAALLARACRDKRLLKHHFFYLYVLLSFLADGFILLAYARLPVLGYARIYWAVEFGSDLMTCGILYEISECVFGRYRQTQRFARIPRTFAWIIALGFSCVYALRPVLEKFGQITTFDSFDFSRAMLEAQAVLLVVIISGILYFGTPVGRNVKGLILGMGVQTLGMALTFATWSLFHSFYVRFGVLLSMVVGYTALLIWLVSLWNYHPDPVVSLQKLRLEVHRELLNRIAQIKKFVYAFLAAPFKLRYPSP